MYSKYIIIGNSAGGIGAVEGIRQVDKDGEITIISDEPYHTYSRPLISYFLKGKISEEKIKYRNDDFYEVNNVNFIPDERVRAINYIDKKVITDSKELTYDKLLTATGSSPFVPNIKGLDTVKKWYTFMTLDDMKALEKNISPDSKVLILGAGLIGLKCAEGIINSVAEVIVADLSPQILSSILDDKGAELVREHLEKNGINFLLSHNLKEFKGNSAVFENGDVTEFDILVMAVGVRPNTILLKDIADIDKGIIVNNKCETSCKDIYAAGDCTQSLDASSGEKKVMALLPNAYMQGECAGINMAGKEKIFSNAIPMNALGLFGIHIITAGNYCGEVYSDVSEGHYKKLFYSENKLNGCILIDKNTAEVPIFEKAGIYTSLIREKMPLDSLDFELICEKPGLMAFTKEEREIKLGGVLVEA